ncbi:hypothetical protein DAPPUDRAFT_268197 [Daphnia pulex]|uniref:DUF6729 domain-containing protein n=1 Tax=Daphnia pulex TaxID=6669 RepID=E9HXE0_DAPPU|nr:hypothetical protein DAPPUDRAFT_268197 [Daphnia pulex]|eukprot:EFX63591.1 hypothetical protein DAPPUDRAFT_268197 [Daphnia pulex]
MPQKPKLNSEWEKRILEFVAGKSFGQGQRSGKTTKWGKVVERIEKCPMRTLKERGKDVMGRLRVCECGYHVSHQAATSSGDNQLLATGSSQTHSTVKQASNLGKLIPFPQVSHQGATSASDTQPIRNIDYTHRLPSGWLDTVDKIYQQWIGKNIFASKGTLVANLKTWWYPPPVTRSSAEAYFFQRFFLWMPRKMWAIYFTCPICSDVQSLTSKGLYNRVRKVIDLTCRYYLAAEYLECRSCCGTFISYDARLLSQLPDAKR